MSFRLIRSEIVNYLDNYICMFLHHREFRFSIDFLVHG